MIERLVFKHGRHQKRGYREKLRKHGDVWKWRVCEDAWCAALSKIEGRSYSRLVNDERVSMFVLAFFVALF
jgi:hypothetical protein